MKNKYHWEVLAFILGLTILISGCAGSPNSKCKSNNDCASGYLCDGASACLLGDHIKITTTEVSPAFINNSYSFQITHEGGIDPLTWSIDTSSSSDSLVWLTIDSATGMLINIQGPPEKFPLVTTNTANFKVIVTDSSDNGKGESTSPQPYTMIIRACKSDYDTFKPVNGVCEEGIQRCNNGVLGDFEPANPSTNPNHCGFLNNDQCSNCNASSSNGPVCVAGNCGCNSDSDCSGLKCCGKKCVDTSKDVENCGICGVKCNIGSCTNGACDCNNTNKCPEPSGAPNCFNDKCICIYQQGACPIGKKCCNKALQVGCCDECNDDPNSYSLCN